MMRFVREKGFFFSINYVNYINNVHACESSTIFVQDKLFVLQTLML